MIEKDGLTFQQLQNFALQFIQPKGFEERIGLKPEQP